MKTEWSKVKLKELGHIIGGGTPSTSEPAYWGDEIAWITPKDLSSHKKVSISKGGRGITKLGLKESSARLLPPGAVLFTSRAPIGYVAIAQNDITTNQGFKSIVPNLNSDSSFIFYLLRTVAKDIEGQASGTTFKEVSGTVLGNFEVIVPNKETQIKIGTFLRHFDNQIETLQEQNTVLESIAQTLFKSWFVNFDPVHAKAASGQPEGFSAEIAALFPSEFQESELGLIPKRWDVSTFGDAFDVKGGGTPSTGSPEFWENGTYLWATPKDMSGLTCAVIHETERRITDAGVNKISSKQLPINTVLMSSRAPVGYLAIAKAAISINQGFIAIPPIEDFPPSLVYCLLKNSMEEIKGNAGGSTFAEISKSAFKPIKFVNADTNVRRKFGEICEPLFDLIHVNSLLISNLSVTRDELLPRLISGKIQIEEAEEALADVMPSPEKQVA